MTAHDVASWIATGRRDTIYQDMKNTGQTAVRHQPWYEDCGEQCALAARYISASNQRFKWPGPVLDEIASYDLSTLYKVIYESNLIENAGMSLSDTKNLAEKLRSKTLKDSLSIQDLVKFCGRTRPKKEVVLHYQALGMSTITALQSRPHSIDGEKNQQYEALLQKETNRYGSFSVMDRLKNLETLFDEDKIKTYHHWMAYGLIAPSEGKPGEYRTHPVITNGITAFLAWQNVPAAMKKFTTDANALIRSDENPVFKAARISYDFVIIHPFPDFNGRMSRLIMNMVLRYEGLPFFAVLRGSKKDKHRYIYALRRANRGDIKPYACLIARAVLRGFDELNRNLLAADLEPIVPASD
jgi:Fic family protein